MKAARIHRFGAPDVVVVEEVPRPAPAAGELLIRVAASGVGPWDALIREDLHPTALAWALFRIASSRCMRASAASPPAVAW
jgi:NADPH:quinone reductase-like Zn-dependent oxidoreductase